MTDYVNKISVEANNNRLKMPPHSDNRKDCSAHITFVQAYVEVCRVD